MLEQPRRLRFMDFVQVELLMIQLNPKLPRQVVGFVLIASDKYR
jgi:hypothetical protein